MELTTELMPENIRRPDGDLRPRPRRARPSLRDLLSKRFDRGRDAAERSAATTRPISGSAA